MTAEWDRLRDSINADLTDAAVERDDPVRFLLTEQWATEDNQVVWTCADEPDEYYSQRVYSVHFGRDRYAVAFGTESNGAIMHVFSKARFNADILKAYRALDF